MSLYTLMRSSVSGMQAQATRLGTIGQNVANVDTIGYKRGETLFSSLVMSNDQGTSTVQGGVKATVRRAISESGSPLQTQSATDMSIAGRGFFVVRDATGSTFLTRAGSFRANGEGYLVNHAGYILRGYQVTDGLVQANAGNSLEGTTDIRLKPLSLRAVPTTSGEFAVNLPSTATVDSSGILASANAAGARPDHTSSLVVYDNLGNRRVVDVHFTRVASAAPAGRNAQGLTKAEYDARKALRTFIDNQANLAAANAALGLAGADTLTQQQVDALPAAGANWAPAANALAAAAALPANVTEAQARFETRNLAGANQYSALGLTAEQHGRMAAVADHIAAAGNQAAQDARAVQAAAAFGLEAADFDTAAEWAAAFGTVAAPVAHAGATSYLTATQRTNAGTIDGGDATYGLAAKPAAQAPPAPAAAPTDLQWDVAIFDRSSRASDGGFPYSSAALTTATITTSKDDGSIKAVIAGSPAAGAPPAVNDSRTMTFTVPGGQEVTIDLTNMRSVASDYTPSGLSFNGKSPAEATRMIDVDAAGKVYTILSDGSRRQIFQLALADVPNPDGLLPVNGNAYRVGNESGTIQVGFSQKDGLGSIRPRTLERSNVGLANELTEMIEAQRGYTANTKSFQTGSEVLSLLVNLKR